MIVYFLKREFYLQSDIWNLHFKDHTRQKLKKKHQNKAQSQTSVLLFPRYIPLGQKVINPICTFFPKITFLSTISFHPHHNWTGITDEKLSF